MKRETKAGLIIAASFLSLVAGVFGAKYFQDKFPSNPAPAPAANPANATANNVPPPPDLSPTPKLPSSEPTAPPGFAPLTLPTNPALAENPVKLAPVPPPLESPAKLAPLPPPGVTLTLPDPAPISRPKPPPAPKFDPNADDTIVPPPPPIIRTRFTEGGPTPPTGVPMLDLPKPSDPPKLDLPAPAAPPGLTLPMPSDPKPLDLPKPGEAPKLDLPKPGDTPKLDLPKPMTPSTPPSLDLAKPIVDLPKPMDTGSPKIDLPKPSELSPSKPLDLPKPIDFPKPGELSPSKPLDLPKPIAPIEKPSLNPMEPAPGARIDPSGLRPDPAAEASVNSYEEEWYYCKQGDTLDMISQKYYFTPKYDQALRQYNLDRNPALVFQQDRPSFQAGQVVKVPPARVLERRFPNSISGLARPVSNPRPGAVPASTGGPTPMTPGATQDNSAAREYTVQRDGLTLRDVARDELGSDSHWHRIFLLNRWVNPSAALAVGTRLYLPRSANQ